MVNSPRTPALVERARLPGTSSMMPASATMPMAVMAQKVARHPAAWPSMVPRGTPSTLAMVSPANMNAMAPARLVAGTRSAATTEPMPKNAPWHSAATMRPSMTRS